MNFVLSGGALKLLADFLASRVDTALIVEPKDSDLQILDAVNVRTEGLILKGKSAELVSAFSQYPPTAGFETEHATIPGEWPYAIRIRGMYWAIFVLLRTQPDEALLADLRPCAGMISLWQTVHRIDTAEDRLARLSYMILATKSTLSAVFEPMPFAYYSAFLSDVLRESLFPRSVSLFSDDGRELSFLEGDEREAPARKGFYTEKTLPPVPVVTRNDAIACEVVLPLIEADHRIFCVIEWDRPPTEETLNFLELLGSLATRALSINYLKTKSFAEKDRALSGDYTIFSLSHALTALKEQKDRDRFLALTADIFMELTRAPSCFLVVRDKSTENFLPAVYRRDGIACPFAAIPIPASAPSAEIEDTLFDLRDTPVPGLLKIFGLGESSPWPELESMRYVFPFVGSGRFEGFIALSEENFPISRDSKITALQIVAQFTAFELRKFVL